MTNQPTLSQFLAQHEDLREDCRRLIETVAGVCCEISAITRRGALGGNLGEEIGNTNVQGEEQKQLDLVSNELFVKRLAPCGLLAAMASEEIEELIQPEGKRGALLMAFDPLDGSSNISVNIPVGSIFSILPAPDAGRVAVAEDFFQPGKNQLAAGYAVYGQATMLVLTIGKGTQGFTLDPDSGEFILTEPGYRIPEQTGEYGINSSNQRFWHPPMQRYIEECMAGKEGPRGRNFNMRWVGSMVAETQRILTRGGTYLYPQDTKQPFRPGRLRLLYETSPIGMLVEQAGGKASDCTGPMLEVIPTSLHQRIGVALGSREEVERIEQYHQESPIVL